MPILGLGTSRTIDGDVTRAIEACVDAGYRHIDCAAVYCNEPEIGDAIQGVIKAGKIKREELWITSKLWNTKHAKEAVMPALKKTLSDLKLDYLDLYLIHWPIAYAAGDDDFPKNENGEFMYDDNVPFVETWKMLEQAKRDGLVKNIGLSNFNSRQIQLILDHCEIRPSVMQFECHPYLPQLKLKAYCAKNDIALIAYSPLGAPASSSSKLPGTPVLLKDPKLQEIADKYAGKTPGHVLIRYQIDNNICVIPKSVTPDRIRQNSQVFDFKLDHGDMEALNNIGTNFRYVFLPFNKDAKEYPFYEE